MPKLDYNFKPSYESLPTANVDIRVTDRSNNPTLTAYAGELGKLTVVPVFLSASPEISNLNYKIDLGDGTISKNLSATHYYNTPGEYKITLVVTTSAGNLYVGNLPKIIKVTDIIPDIIHLNYNYNQYTLSGGPGFKIGEQPPSTMAQEIIVTRYNSSVTSSLMDQNDYRINLSVEGNESAFYTQQQFNSDNHFQLKNTSFFANTIGSEFNVIDSVPTTSVDIFAGYTEEKELIVKSFDILTDEEKKFTVKVGTSGIGSFYYYSDYIASEFDTTISEPVINSLTYENDVAIIDNTFFITVIVPGEDEPSALSGQHGLYNGNYILNVPNDTPITILNNGKEDNIRIVSGDVYGNKNVYNTNADGNYNFYTGVVGLYVDGDFDTVRLYPFKEGNINGGILVYNPQSNIYSLQSKL